MSKIKIAIVGIGNCCSSLIQGIHYYKDKALPVLQPPAKSRLVVLK